MGRKFFRIFFSRVLYRKIIPTHVNVLKFRLLTKLELEVRQFHHRKMLCVFFSLGYGFLSCSIFECAIFSKFFPTSGKDDRISGTDFRWPKKKYKKKSQRFSLNNQMAVLFVFDSSIFRWRTELRSSEVVNTDDNEGEKSSDGLCSARFHE